MPTTQTSSLFSSVLATTRTTQTSSLFSSFSVVMTQTSSLFSSRDVKTSQTSSAWRSFVPERRVIYLKDADTEVVTQAGILEPGDTTLTDVAIADGFYEVEVRSSRHYYEESRSRVRFTVEIVGGVVASQGLPNIATLTASITQAFSTQLAWTIPDVAFGSGYSFGIWRSATSPVDVSGSPDFTTQAYKDLGNYTFNLTQTVDEFYAVAAFNDTDQAQEREVFNEWDLTPPNAPYNQYGYTQL